MSRAYSRASGWGGRSSWDLDAQWKKDKLQRAKDIVTETKRLEAVGSPASAELEIKKLVPAL